MGLTDNASHGTKRLPTELLESIQVPVPPLPSSAHRRHPRQGRCHPPETGGEHPAVRGVAPLAFLEMFGDPANNPKAWDLVKIESTLSKTRPGMRCGPFGTALRKEEYTSDGVPVWGMRTSSRTPFKSGSLFITPEKYAELTAYSVHSGDVLISRAGTVGRMCVAKPTQEKSIIGTNLIRVSHDQNTISADYFAALFSYFSDRLAGLRASSDESAYSIMQTGVMRDVVYPYPPSSCNGSSPGSFRLQKEPIPARTGLICKRFAVFHPRPASLPRRTLKSSGALIMWQERIAVDPAILVGKPVIKGTRLAVEFLLDLMAEGWTAEQILGNYPQLTADDLRAALHYAAESLKRERVFPLAV